MRLFLACLGDASGKLVPAWVEGLGEGLPFEAYEFLQSHPHSAILQASTVVKSTAVGGIDIGKEMVSWK